METQNLEWLIFNALHGDVSGDIPEDLQVVIKAEQELHALLARHNALVDALAWERECEDVAQWRYEVWEMAEVGSGDCEIYTVAQCIHDEARSEVERLIANEGAADCKGEG